MITRKPKLELMPGHLPQRLHHNAYVVADQERTRHFYEDVLGLPLIATWIEREEHDGMILVFSHTFYGLADGSALAFFSFKEPEQQALFAAMRQGLFVHIALKVSQEVQDAIRDRCEREGIALQTLDHGYCTSLYVVDPDGLTLEFAKDHPRIEAINAHQVETAHASLARWQAGDTTPNNDVRGV
jgi:catechol 2,3-dioxygenase-like lactoylglutathione lyase family enzyme